MAEEHGLERSGRDVRQHLRIEADRVEDLAQPSEARFVLGAAIDIVEDAARQTPPSELAKLRDIQRLCRFRHRHRASAGVRVEENLARVHQAGGVEQSLDALHQG